MENQKILTPPPPIRWKIPYFFFFSILTGSLSSKIYKMVMLLLGRRLLSSIFMLTRHSSMSRKYLINPTLNYQHLFIFLWSLIYVEYKVKVPEEIGNISSSFLLQRDVFLCSRGSDHITERLWLQVQHRG